VINPAERSRTAFARRRHALLSIAAIAMLSRLLVCAQVLAQAPNAFEEVSGEFVQPHVARPASDVLRRLEHFEQRLEHGSWSDMSELADELLANDADGWVALDDGRFVGVREAVNRRLAALPRDGLAAYRERVDALAADWLRHGIDDRDERMLRKVVDEAFCSSAGDDALWALGEIALERGDYEAARANWRQIHEGTAGDKKLANPDSKIRLADVRARLALVSIREGDLDRAQREVDEISRRHPDAVGPMGGQEVKYATELAELIEEARDWPPDGATSADWPTLSDNAQRTNIAFSPASLNDEYQQAWSVPLDTSAAMERDGVELNAFPIVVDGRVIFQDATGIYDLPLGDGEQAIASRRQLFASDRRAAFPGPLSLSADHSRVFAVVPVVNPSGSGVARSQLVGFDLSRDGALIFQQAPAADAAVFLAPPIIKRDRVIVCELAAAQGVKASVVCYDLWKGTVVWRRSLGWAYDVPTPGGSPAAGMAIAEDAGVLFVNTQLGMIAAIRAADGEPLWLRTYKRAFSLGDGAELLSKGYPPNPSVVRRSTVIAASHDAAEVIAVDAATGEMVWSKERPEPEARLLAVDDQRVLLSGERLWALDRASGEANSTWGAELSGGAGQGVVAGELIFWPTVAEILLVDRATGKPNEQALPLPAIGGANLVVAKTPAAAGEFVIAAGPTHLTAYRRTSKDNETSEERLNSE
jgi:cellulose synthase operon protein C